MSEPLLSDAALRRIKKSRRLALALSRSLTALQLADEHSPPKNAPSQPSEADRGSQRRRPIPRQVAAPIMTDIDDNRLVSVPGPPVATSEAERYKSEYLAKQLHSIIAALRSSSNQSKSVIAAFSEARALLEGWSTARLLAFGAHLHLLEKYAVGVREEVMDDTRHQLDAWLDNARQFVTSFDEWHAYMEKPIARAERVTEVTQPVREVVEQAAQALGRESDAVEQRIPVQLNEWRDLMAAGNARRTRLVGAVSSLRSMLNISISFVRYRTAMAARGVGELVRHPRVQAVLRTMCAFLPLATKLAPLHPEFAFLVERKEELRMWCEGLKNAKAI